MISLIKSHKKQIASICQHLNIHRLEVFGSAATGRFDPIRSDVDFLVEFEQPKAPPGLLSRYMALATQLEEALGHKVELITPQSVRNPYFRKSVDASKEVVYEN